MDWQDLKNLYVDTKMGKQESQKPKLLSKNYSIILIRNMLHFYFLLTWSIEELMIVIWCLKVPQNIFFKQQFLCQRLIDCFMAVFGDGVFSHLEDDDSVMSLEQVYMLQCVMLQQLQAAGTLALGLPCHLWVPTYQGFYATCVWQLIVR